MLHCDGPQRTCPANEEDKTILRLEQKISADFGLIGKKIGHFHVCIYLFTCMYVCICMHACMHADRQRDRETERQTDIQTH